MLTMVAGLLAVPVVQAFVRFIGVGCVGLSVDAGVFSPLDARHFAPEISRAASRVLATVVTWQLNRHITFGPIPHHVTSLRPPHNVPDRHI